MAEKELSTERARRAQLEQKVGQLTIENDWLKKICGNCRPIPGRGLVERDENRTVAISRQTQMLEVPRASAYSRESKGISDEELELMRLIDRHHTCEPTWGYRMITSHLREAHGLTVNRKRISTDWKL